MKNKKGAVLNAYKFVTKKLTPWTLEGGSKTRPKKYSKQISSDVTIFVYGKWRSIYIRPFTVDTTRDYKARNWFEWK